nr:MAG TPA: hypothetical protein [Caudoviricetes sp.]
MIVQLRNKKLFCKKRKTKKYLKLEKIIDMCEASAS